MTQRDTLNVKLSNSQLNKLKSEIYWSNFQIFPQMGLMILTMRLTLLLTDIKVSRHQLI